MTAINNTQDLGSDLFAFSLGYNTAKHGADALYNGNIAFTEWKNAGDQTLHYYGYQYDGLNRIKSALSDGNTYDVTGITYDLNGNIKTLKRKGYQGNHDGTIDNLEYDYSGNQLTSVSDLSGNIQGFKDGNWTGVDYAYDANGNLLRDKNKAITGIAYNHLNLPTTVATSQGTLNYTYDASGVKLKKTVGSDVTQYAGAFLYKNGTLEMIHMPEGYIEHDNGVFKYVYRLLDHLGNTRVSFQDADGNGSIDPDNEVVEVNDYYPYGMLWQTQDRMVGGNLGDKFRYNGKEMVDDIGLDWYDFGARNYSPELGRWMNLDPLAEQMRRHSPYNYAFDNPIFFIDPDGMAPIPPSMTGFGLMLNRIKKTAENMRNGDGLLVAYGKAAAEDPALNAVAEEVPGLGEAMDIAKGDYVGAAVGIIPGGKKAKKVVEKVIEVVKDVKNTSRSARRAAMRKEGIPTSQQPKSQSKNESGREYTYETDKGTKSVQQQTKDRSHKDQPHWEAGEVKKDNGTIQHNNYGRPKLKNNKSKVDYDEN